MDAFEKVQFVVRALQSRKALDIVILDLRGLTIIADYFVIATGTSTIHIRGMVDAIFEQGRTVGIKSLRAEGLGGVAWVLIDLGDVVVHLFDAEQRDFYQLERLWIDAPRVPLPEEAP